MILHDSLEVFDREDFGLIQDVLESRELESELLGLIKTLKKDCQQILIYALYHETPMEEIARKMGFRNAQNARNKKYRCLKKLQEIIGASEYWRSLMKELRS